MFVCTCACTHVCTCLHASVYVFVCACMCVRVSACVWMCHAHVSEVVRARAICVYVCERDRMREI